MVYSDEDNVYDATGMKTSIVQALSGKDAAAVTALITDYIVKADRRIKQLLGVPYTVRKEFHIFHYNEKTVALGPQDDNFEFFGDYDPANLVEKVFAVYCGGRIKLPYPKDCDSLTEAITLYTTGANCALTAESTIVKCGTKSIKAVKSSIASDTKLFTYPTGLNLDKAISTWDYVSFWFYASDKTSTYTIRLYDKDGNYMYHDFTVDVANTWVIIALSIAEFTAGQAASIEWTETNLQYFVLLTSKTATTYFDNFSLNDGVFWTVPEGLICWSKEDTTPSDAEIQVTYSYDPFKLVVPADIELASAKMAGILLLEYLIGCRQRVTAFEQGSDALDNYPDRETLEFTKARLEREIQEILAGTGFKTYSGIGAE